jgi:hypothetical protein
MSLEVVKTCNEGEITCVNYVPFFIILSKFDVIHFLVFP